jgi:hypothetical protein
MKYKLRKDVVLFRIKSLNISGGNGEDHDGTESR